MNNAAFHARLRRILRASMSAPLGLAACGGSVRDGDDGSAAEGGVGMFDAWATEASSDVADATPPAEAAIDAFGHSDEGEARKEASIGMSDAPEADASIDVSDAGPLGDASIDVSDAGPLGDASIDGLGHCSVGPQIPGSYLCMWSVALMGDPASCGLGSGHSSGSVCQALCRGNDDAGLSTQSGARCTLVQTDAGNRVACTIFCSGGRRPAGLAVAVVASGTQLGRYFADVAALEEASVDAFAILRAELAAHGAPQRLLRAARRAARDEVRHARVTGALARRYGAAPQRPRVERRPVRSLEAIATENEVEGCVRETYGALVGMWQARFARDAGVRRAMDRIARDEARHAALAWEVARWLKPRLDQTARGRVERARRAAVAELSAEMVRDPAPSLVQEAGLPPAATALALIDQTRCALWDV